MSEPRITAPVNRLTPTQKSHLRYHRLLQTTLGLLILILLLLMTATPANAEWECHDCGVLILDEPRAWWGGKPFCSEPCKDRFWERYKEEHPTVCRICNIKLQLPGVVQNNGNMTFIVVGNAWDGYCDHCRRQVNAGVIDPPPPQKHNADGVSSRRVKRPRTPLKVEPPRTEEPLEYFHKPKINIKKWIFISIALIAAWILKRSL